MNTEYLSIDNIPTVIFGDGSNAAFLFLHGKCGCKEEGALFAETVNTRGWQVLSIDLPEHGERRDSAERFVPWDIVPELKAVFAYMHHRWGRIALRANSIGAWFGMQALADELLERCLFVSPLLDMDRLIRDMMEGAGVSEERLCAEKEIILADGETLSWRYLTYARKHELTRTRLDAPTAILYAGNDSLTARDTVMAFAARFGCCLDIMENGEHWFHTPEQLAYLKKWTETNVPIAPTANSKLK